MVPPSTWLSDPPPPSPWWLSPPFQIMVNLPLGTTAVFNGVTELKKLGMINVTELKKFAADRDRCNPKDLYATFMGKPLEDTWTLEKCNLQRGSMVNVSLRMPGGGFTTRKRATPPAPTLEPPPAAPTPAAPAAPAAAPVAGPALASAPLAPDAAVAARRAAKRRQGGAADDDAEVSLGRVLHSAGEGALGAWLEAKKRVVHCLNVGSGMNSIDSPLTWIAVSLPSPFLLPGAPSHASCCASGACGWSNGGGRFCGASGRPLGPSAGGGATQLAGLTTRPRLGGKCCCTRKQSSRNPTRSRLGCSACVSA